MLSRQHVLAALLAGLALGLVSAPHCLGMCGPLAAFAGMPVAAAAVGPSRWRPLRWQLGRLGAYAALGAAAGAIGAQGLRALAPSWAGVALSVALAIALLVAAARLWSPEWLAKLSRRADVAPSRLARGRSAVPLATRILARAPREPFVLGALTALLPCGALWSGVLVAAGAGSVVGGALAMVGFALASGAALLFAGVIGARAQASIGFRRSLAAALVAGALVTMLRPLPALLADEPTASCHVE